MSQGRALSPQEISRLTEQGCTCADWSQVQVAEGFRPERVRTTHFCGPVKLGVFEKEVSFYGGVTKPAGISHATIHNCTIGNNVYISQVRNYIANYVIEDDAVIDNIDLLAVDGRKLVRQRHEGHGGQRGRRQGDPDLRPSLGTYRVRDCVLPASAESDPEASRR